MLSHVADKYLFCLQNINFQITYIIIDSRRWFYTEIKISYLK